MKKIKNAFILFLLMVIIITGCSLNQNKYQKYHYTFTDTFDTVIQIVGYAESEEKFNEYCEIAHEKFLHYHQLFDKYNNYENLNNIKTINDNAGKQAIEVEQELINMLEFSKEWYNKTNGKINIAFGSVLSIWHDYREFYKYNENGVLPPETELKSASEHTDIENVIIDKNNNTVFLNDSKMSLDVGAIAKGYATELIGNELYEMGFHSFILNSGGNVKVYDAPPDDEINAWAIGVEDPHKNPMDFESEYLDIAFINNKAFVTSGNYMRYYTVDGKKYHHIIDPSTNYPAQNFSSVTVLTESSSVGDIASTALYIMNFEDGKKFAEENNLDVMWVYDDGEIVTTISLNKYLNKRGNATNKK